MQNEITALEMVKRTMSELYYGRSFVVGGCALTPSQAFAPEGALPLFAARAGRRFRLVHPTGIQLERCVRCGLDRAPETGSCFDPCPMRAGQRRLNWPISFELTDDTQYLLRVSTAFVPSRAGLTVALFFLHDTAQEMLMASPDPRSIPIDGLIQDLALEINPKVQQLQEQAQQQRATEVAGEHAAAPVSHRKPEIAHVKD